MTNKPDLEDYVDVAERVRLFVDKYPEGSLQSEIVELTASRVTVRAYAYRTPTDARPGMGLAHLEVPGSTPFTRGSELENAETSAWGRAIVAVGIGAKRHIASADEVRHHQQVPAGGFAPASPPPGAPRPRPPEEAAALDELLAVEGMTTARLELLADAVKVPKGRRATLGELRAMLDIARRQPGTPTAWPEPGSAPFEALSAYDRATARAWWQKHDGAAVDSPPTAAPSPEQLTTEQAQHVNDPARSSEVTA